MLQVQCDLKKDLVLLKVKLLVGQLSLTPDRVTFNSALYVRTCICWLVSRTALRLATHGSPLNFKSVESI